MHKIEPLLETLRLEDISDEEYFSEKFSNYISNSRLSLINPAQGGSPEKFFFGGFNNFSDSLIFGSACHQLVLQPESYFVVETIDRPTGKTGYIADYTYNKSGHVPTREQLLEASKKYDFYKGNPSESKLEELISKCNNYWRNRALFEHSLQSEQLPIYLSARDRERLNGCISNLNKNPKIQELLHPTSMVQEPITANEKTILLDVLVDDSFILKLKSKLDNYSIDLDLETITVNDLKTTGKMVNLFDEAIDKYHYYRELAMYAYLLNLCAKKFYSLKDITIKGNFLVVSTIPDYYTKVVPMTKKLFNLGFKEFKNLLNLVADYVTNDPRYKFFASL